LHQKVKNYDAILPDGLFLAAHLYYNETGGSPESRKVRQFCMVNKVRLTIAGTTYVVSTTDSEEYVTQLAQQLDAGMKEAMKASPSLSITRAAVFCALDYLDQYKKSTGSADNMRSQIKDYLADAAKAKLEAEDARREIERLKREVQYLKEQNGSAPSGRA
jgi:cell division protein ZapA